MNLLSKEEIESRNAKVREKGEELAIKRKEDESILAKIQWLENGAKLDRECADAVEKVKTAAAKKETEEYKSDEQTVNQWRMTSEPRAWLGDIDKAEKDARRQESRLANSQQEFLILRAGQKWEAANLVAKKSELGKVEKSIASQEPRKYAIDNAQTILGWLDSILRGRDTISSETNKKTQAEESLGKVESEMENAESDLKTAEEKFTELEFRVTTLEDKLKDARLPGLRKNKEDLQTRRNHAITALERLTLLEEARKRRTDAKADIDKQETEINGLNAKAEQIQIELGRAEIEKNKCEQAYNAQKETVEKWAIAMRHKLRSGELCECPVCKQKVLKVPEDEVLNQLSAVAEEGYKRAKREYDVLLEESQEKRAEKKVREERIKAAKLSFDKDESVDKAENAASQACSLCGITLDADAYSWLQEIVDNTNADIDEVQKKIKAAEGIQEDIDNARKMLEDTRKGRDTKQNELYNIQNTKNEILGKIGTSKKLIESKEEEVAATEQKVAEMVDTTLWANDWKAQTKEFSEELRATAEQYGTWLRLQQRLWQDALASATLCRQIEATTGEIEKQMPQWSNLQVDESMRHEDIVYRLGCLQSEITSANEQHTNAIEKREEAQRHLNEYLASNWDISREMLQTLSALSGEDISAIEMKNGAIRDEVFRAEEIVKQLEKHKEESDRAKPQMQAEDNIQSLGELRTKIDEEVKKISQEIGAIRRDMEQDELNKKQLASLMKEVEEKKAEYDKWNPLDNMIGDALGKKFRKIAQGYVLSNLINSANFYMRKLGDRYKLYCEPGSLLISVEDSYQGFARRASSTISGGERFIVSLALALALSDIGQGLKVDTLFIDEGFGTLSKEYLQNAIATLRSLHSATGRHVGIISHIEELSEHIPVQIRVNQANSSSYSSISVVPSIS